MHIVRLLVEVHTNLKFGHAVDIIQSATKLMSCVNRRFSFLHCSQPLLSIFLGHVWLEMG